ncbi:MAG: site-specific DNA-methyltransferase [Eggerthellaceae bacterium]|nr:site-specific DNA-methyltransferase [Eggerthellaceae bacterium]
MALLQDLIQQVEDSALRERILAETDKLLKQKKFGLVFEEHLPECTPLWDVPIRVGTKVARKAGYMSNIFTVLEIDGKQATCLNRETKEQEVIPLDDLVAIAEFGEPIYPYLKPIDSVCNAPDSSLWHTLIEADNYHALQLLEYLYAGKVDCIYIDPPYNTGARDWKYNNDYVDSSDAYRHSKWLSMMQKRLKIAKRLLNPKDSVLIVTIDEKEYLHLGCLLEEMFPSNGIHMVSTVINPAGSSRPGSFARTDEYAFFIHIGDAKVSRLPLGDEWRVNPEDKRTTRMLWSMLKRTGTGKNREDSPNLFYPIFVDPKSGRIVDIGETVPYGISRTEVPVPDGLVACWPIHDDGKDGRWMVSQQTLRGLVEKGYVRVGRPHPERGYTINYLKSGEIKKIESGIYEITGRRDDGSVVSDSELQAFIPGTAWRIPSHDASRNGSNLISSILPGHPFSFPKSLYAVRDAIRFFVANKPNALIVDFFAGSGTTLHAVNLLNAEDGGNRRCILVTNNEVSDAEAKQLTKDGHRPGDDEWESLGIARYVTWPRTVCSIEGHDVNGKPLKGSYLGSDRPMADGFEANAAYFKLGFLDKTSVALGRQFKELLPTLWMKAGAVGTCPTLDTEELPQMLILPENSLAVLIDEEAYPEFEKQLAGHPDIQTAFIVTDSQSAYRNMIKDLGASNTYQLYRDYLDNFRINTQR